MKILMTAALLASSAFVATAADAALLGRQVNGTIQFGANPTNYYDPANGFVPGGFGNSGGQPVTIAAGTEFGFQDGANMDTADFSDTQLTIRDVVFSNAANWKQTFTLVGSPGFASISLVNDAFVPGLTYSLNNGVIEINWAGTNAANDFTAVFNVTAGNAVPEPASWALMISGFGLAGAALRRRVRTSVSFA
ncbi:MAG: PEP-CTERM sorting domain-containing protein [Proteobacteria bacterium]|nr:PEP-CTERM sorting domain-containing protein [Pseudomonadota bacterium]